MAATATRKTVLLLDGDRNSRQVLKYQLTELDLNVDAVADGDTALERCGSADYDLILVHVNVPVIRAFSFLQLVKLSRPHIPVLVVSAFSTMENVATAFRWGASDFLEKPFELAALRDRIRQCMAQCRR